MAINTKKYIDNLTKALEKEGKYYTVTTKRFKSERTGRYCTKYSIRDSENKGIYREAYNKLDLLKFLASEYYKVTGKSVPPSLIVGLGEKEE